jgi:tetratricopeptide (TPR) repeat protein
MQSELAQNISDRLRLSLTGDEQKRLSKRYTRNPEAYQLYLKGRYYINQPSEEETKRGLKYFEEAIHLDPGNAQAFAGLADAYFNLSNVFMPPTEAMPRSRKAAMNALELDETLGEAHASLAVVKSHYDWDWAEAEREYQRAIELNPGYAFAHQMYGYYLTAMGRSDDALAQYRLAKELDPLTLSASIAMVWPYYFAPRQARQYALAAEELRKLVRFNPTSPTAHGLLGLVLAETGSGEEAVAELAEARKIEDAAWFLAGQGYAQAIGGKRRKAEQTLAELTSRMDKGEHVQSISLAFLYTGLGDKDRAFAALQKAFENRDEEMILLNVDPKFDRLRSDSRFAELLRRMNLTAGRDISILKPATLRQRRIQQD